MFRRGQEDTESLRRMREAIRARIDEEAARGYSDEDEGDQTEQLPTGGFGGGTYEGVPQGPIFGTPVGAYTAQDQPTSRPVRRERRAPRRGEIDRRGLVRTGIIGLGLFALAAEEIKFGLVRNALGAAGNAIFRRGSSTNPGTTGHEEAPVAVDVSATTLLAKGPTEAGTLVEQNVAGLSTAEVIDLIGKLPWGNTRATLYKEYASRVATGTAGAPGEVVAPTQAELDFWRGSAVAVKVKEAYVPDALNGVVFALNHCRSLFGDPDVQAASEAKGGVYHPKKNAGDIILKVITLGLQQSALGLAMGTAPIAEILPTLDKENQKLVIEAIEKAKAAAGVELTPQNVFGTPIPEEKDVRFGIGAANAQESLDFTALVGNLNLLSPQDWLKGMVLYEINNS